MSGRNGGTDWPDAVIIVALLAFLAVVVVFT